MIAALNNVADFANAGVGDFFCCAREGIDAADFFHRSGGDRENVAANTEQNDLFGRKGLRLRWRRKAHGYLTPTGAVLQRPMTRFSMAG